MASNDSYVLIKLRHDFDLVEENQEGELVPLQPYVLPDGAYMYRGMIGEIHFPETTIIGKDCFKMCSQLDTVDIRNVIDIGDSAFQDCIAIEELATPKLMTVGNSTFQGCTKLKSIDLDKTTSVGWSAFQDCESLETISLPKVRQIGDNCFRGCRKLKSVSAPNITRIGMAAFYGCRELENVIFPQAQRIGTPTSNDEIEEGVFQECSSLKTVVLPCLIEIGKNTFTGCTSATYISLPNVPCGGIPQYAFSDCHELEWLNLSCEVPAADMSEYKVDIGVPDKCNVICLGGEICYGTGFTVGNFKSDKLNYTTSAVDGTTANYISGVKSGQSLSGELVDAFAQGIKNSAMQNQTQLESMLFPSLKYDIGNEAFKNCTTLKRVVMPVKDMSYAIGNNAFQGCSSLSYIEFTNATKQEVNQSRSTHNWGIRTVCSIVCKDGVIEI